MKKIFGIIISFAAVLFIVKAFLHTKKTKKEGKEKTN